MKKASCKSSSKKTVITFGLLGKIKCSNTGTVTRFDILNLDVVLLLISPQFEHIQRLEGHHGEVWALALSHFGKFVVTGSHDKSIRVWEKLDDPVRSTMCFSQLYAC